MIHENNIILCFESLDPDKRVETITKLLVYLNEDMSWQLKTELDKYISNKFLGRRSKDGK